MPKSSPRGGTCEELTQQDFCGWALFGSSREMRGSCVLFPGEVPQFAGHIVKSTQRRNLNTGMMALSGVQELQNSDPSDVTKTRPGRGPRKPGK